ncbi:MAG: hypothetical protein QXW91_00830 [Candidatus Nitrosotenuis sp.]
MAFSDRFDSPLAMLFKGLIGLGIIVIAISLMLYLSGVVASATGSIYAQLAIVGIVILVFAFLAKKIFEGV